jgi:hypothetical protein
MESPLNSCYVPISSFIVQCIDNSITVGLRNGHIMGLSKSVLDPRRPLKHLITAADREEGLLPYESNVSLSYKAYVNYYKRVHDIQGIHTVPTALESTSLMTAYGLDIFCTRVAPSSTFDILNEDFNYTALVVTSITLLLLTVTSTWIAKRRDFTKTWK